MKTSLLRRLAAGLLAAGGLWWAAAAGAAGADAWPARPIRLVVPYGAGGTPDIVARLLGQKMAASLGQTVIVDNKPGANGVIAAEAVKGAAPDGYTLWMADTGQLAIAPALQSRLAYDPVKDFTPVSQVTEQAFSVIVRADSPAHDLKELIELSKSRPNGLFYGTSGIGTVHHVGSEQLRLLTGGRLTHVPYKGVAQSVPALLAGDIDVMLSSATPVMAQWKAGKVRILARGSAKRSALMPEVPTLAEAGVPLEVLIKLGFLAPAGTPPEIVRRLQAELAKAVHDPEVVHAFAGQDFELVGSTPEQYAATIRDQLQIYRKVVKDAAIQAE